MMQQSIHGSHGSIVTRAMLVATGPNPGRRTPTTKQVCIAYRNVQEKRDWFVVMQIADMHFFHSNICNKRAHH
ncbi:hypothetical protein A2U01_0058316, partial [Trifolium medium]|nr:hypothetical protein [Trifolium medium]